MDSKVAAVNDSPVGCQSRDPADPQIGESTVGKKQVTPCASYLFYWWKMDSKVAVVNDSPVGCQSRDPADPQIGESTFGKKQVTPCASFLFR